MSKQLLTTLFLSLSLSTLCIANIIQIEYFFDNDPGFGMGITIATNTPEDELNLGFQADISNLNLGVHQLYVRALNTAGDWSLLTAHTFAILPAIGDEIVAFEYYFNEDPGFGNATAIDIDAANPAEGDWTITIPNLPLGEHQFYLRAQDNLGNWSLYSTQTIAVNTILDCDNVTDAGEIGFDQQFCDVISGDPDPFVSISPATGGSGALEYLWIFTTNDPTTGTVVWYPIPDSNSPTYDADILTETTYFRRCARREDCDEYVAESNIVVVEIADCMNDCDLYKVELEAIIQPLCHGDTDGEVVFSIVAGMPPFTYVLNGQTLAEAPSNLPAGNYILSVIDANDCTDQITFSITEPPLIIYLAETTDATCATANGSIEIQQIAGGTPPYNLLWSTDETTMLIENLAAGSYNLTITDANMCTVEGMFEVISEGELNVIANVENVACFGDMNGSITLLPNGLPPYQYSWSNGAITATIDNLSSGNYGATITDAGGCTTSYSTAITEPDLLLATATLTPEDCDESNGSIDAMASGGTPPYTYFWNNMIGEIEDPTGLASDDYKATITDTNGCVIFLDVFVEEIGCLTDEEELEFLSFTAELVGENEGDILLNWQVANQSNNTIYSIEHARQATDLQSISEWISSNDLANYNYTLSEMGAGRHYFQIRSFSEIHGIILSTIIQLDVQNEGAKSMYLYPNPVQNEVTILFQNPMIETAKIALYDVHGRLLETRILESETSALEWNMEGNNSGVYFLKLKRKGRRAEVLKVVKM